MCEEKKVTGTISISLEPFEYCAPPEDEKVSETIEGLGVCLLTVGLIALVYALFSYIGWLSSFSDFL